MSDSYDAAGIKVQKKVTDGTTIKTTDYLDGFQYDNQVLQFFPHAEGYVKATVMTMGPGNPVYGFNYVYNYTDHLGNIRLSYAKDPQSGDLKVMEENNYYPFGLKHNYGSSSISLDFQKQLDDWGVILAPVTNNPYNYKYNGKELQDELGLNMYDMDMRMYDPAIARWAVLDPVIHHSFSPYNAFDNNPVFWADPSGADAESSDSGSNDYNPSGIRAMGIPIEAVMAASAGGSAFAQNSGNSKDDIIVRGKRDGKDQSKKAVKELRKSFKGELKFKFDKKTGKVTAVPVKGAVLSNKALAILDASTNPAIRLQISADKTNVNIGAFKGTQVLRNSDGTIKMVIARQEIIPGSLQKMDKYFGTPGANVAHEFVESYLAAIHSLNTGENYLDSNHDESFYEHIHNETNMIAPQTSEGATYYDYRDSSGNQIEGNTIPAGGSGVIYVDDGKQGPQVIWSYP